jgi:sigma-B regulation protein RsbU (phosphoserine phosphatase)
MQIVLPMQKIIEEARRFAKENNKGEKTSLKDISKITEMCALGDCVETMENDILQYTENLKVITAETERIGTELALATNIQANMLPNIFPAFPEIKEFDIFASMDPAKEVGGDFYDFFLIDEDHLGLVMADVSGKGVPAALFMMMSKIMLNNYAMMGGSPKEVLERVNNSICKNNENDMFVTVWFGILEHSTGHVVAANAGHEYPAIRKADGHFELIKDIHGLAIGIMEEIQYKEYEFKLEKGDTLFIYTDGVPEATDSTNELYGNERMLEALNSSPDILPETIVKTVKEKIDEFVGEAPQFDDITMLAIQML